MNELEDRVGCVPGHYVLPKITKLHASSLLRRSSRSAVHNRDAETTV